MDYWIISLTAFVKKTLKQMVFQNIILLICFKILIFANTSQRRRTINFYIILIIVSFTLHLMINYPKFLLINEIVNDISHLVWLGKTNFNVINFHFAKTFTWILYILQNALWYLIFFNNHYAKEKRINLIKKTVINLLFLVRTIII